jgi:hypothetical protein
MLSQDAPHGISAGLGAPIAAVGPLRSGTGLFWQAKLVLKGGFGPISGRVPIGAAGLMSAKIVKNATLKVYLGYPHGMLTTHAEELNADLLGFFQGTKQAAA